MTAEELGGRVNDNVCTMLQRANQVGRAEGVAMLMGYGCYTFQVEHVRVRVAKGLGIYNFCVGLDSGLQGREVVNVDNGVGDALSG